MELFGKMVDMLGTSAFKKFGREQLKGRMHNQKQLVVVQPDHWMMEVLCKYKREQHELLWGTGTSLSGPYRIQELTVGVAAEYSRMWPEYEPLLIEVVFTRSLHQFTHEGNAPTDVQGFEAFFLEKLRSDRIDGWFGIQFFIDSLDVLALAPYFYKTKVSNSSVRDLISRCVVDGRGNVDACFHLLVKRMTKEKNRAAYDGWVAWMGEELASVGSPKRSTLDNNLFFLRTLVLNATDLNPDKPAYFPVVVQVRGAAVSREMCDHYAYILPKATTMNWLFPGFIYHPHKTNSK